nr:MAG: hypothetical protein 3 [Leviviridae sp.]
MTKSHSDNLLIVAQGILKDVQAAFPDMPGVDRDISRLTQLVKERGLGVFTLDLPRLDSALTSALETGFLDSKGSICYSKSYRVPRLFAGLYMKIFDKMSCLRDDADINAVAFLRQLLCLGKKTEIPCSVKRKFIAIKEYFDVERQIRKPTLLWDSDTLVTGEYNANRIHLCDALDCDLPLFPHKEREARITLLLNRCQRVADFIAGELGIFCPECVIDANRADGKPIGFKHGPGAVAERSGRFFDKYQFTSWSAKLERLFPFSLYGKMPNDPSVKPVNHEVPARLIAVPKTAKGPRLIAAEPSEHMYVQKFTAKWLEDRINSTIIGKFIDFRDQSKSGDLVLQASLDKKLSTIDLSMASDRLSLWVVERIFRNNPSILKAFHASRTRWLHDPLTGEVIKLKKFASQGTALTFPIQSIVFLCLALAVSCKGSPTDYNLRKLVGKVRTFGDDIILPSDGYVSMVDLLHTLNLKVNVEKSFSNGYFRESCGVDAFKGYDVTPVKPKTTIPDGPASCQAVLDTINNLFYKGYWNASESLRHRQPPRIRNGYGVVGRDAGATGYGSFSFGTVLSRLFRIEWSANDRACSDPIRWYNSRFHDSASFAKSESRKRHESLFKLSTGLGHVLSTCGLRYRINHRLHRTEVRLSQLKAKGRRTKPYDCGYSGLLDGQLCPTPLDATEASGVRGVPERPRLVIETRWVAVSDLF